MTKKYQATIPNAVRQRLHLGAGDAIAFEINEDRIEIRKANAIDLDYLTSLETTLSEWNSEADDEAYRDL